MGFVDHYGPWAVVAGASEGIGAAFCHQLAARGVNLVMVARRPGPLEALASNVREAHGVEAVAVPADLGREDVMDALAPALAGREVGLLVYNAAASTIGPFLDVSEASRLASVHVNCRGPVLLLPHVMEPMRARGRGGIILLSSLSGTAGTAWLATYAATKAFTTALGEALWEELRPHGVHVLVSVAGATTTPGFERQTPAERRASAFPMTPEAVAEDALARLDRGPVTVPGRINQLAAFLLRRLLGRRAAVRFMSRNTRQLYDNRP